MNTGGDHTTAADAFVELPEGLPVLGRGKHTDATRGACLMEYTALLAGQRFSDRPVCTHPALAELARQVNDRIGDTTRPQLATRAPMLAGLGPKDPGVAAAVGAAAEQVCARLAPESLGGRWRRWLLRGLRRRDTARRSRWGRHRDTATARTLLLAALDHIETLPRSSAIRERALVGVLDRALALASDPDKSTTDLAAARRGSTSRLALRRRWAAAVGHSVRRSARPVVHPPTHPRP